MGGSDQRDAARRERRRIIERLDAMEAELPRPRVERTQSSEGDPEVEIEKERRHNYSRRGFGQAL